MDTMYRRSGRKAKSDGGSSNYSIWNLPVSRNDRRNMVWRKMLPAGNLLRSLGQRTEQSQTCDRTEGTFVSGRAAGKTSQKLLAPRSGAMQRTVCEHAACAVRYRLLQHGAVIFDEICAPAGFEADLKRKYTEEKERTEKG